MPSKTKGQSYDILVIGAGPAGLSAVQRVLQSAPSASVLLVDKTTPWIKPIPCAEGVGRLGFEEATPVDKSWIRFVISNAQFHAPNGTSIQYADKNKGYIINRATMQRDMAQKCRELGAECVFDRRIARVGESVSGKRTVEFHSGAKVDAQVVIDSSGPLSSFGKGEDIAWKCPDLEPSYFAVVEGVKLTTDTVHIYVARDLAPGGYAWAFPRDDGVANVGVLVGAPFRAKVNIVTLLNAFVRKHFPDGKTTQRFAGPIPCAYSKRTMATIGLIKAGDSASTANPISRAGIVEAMISGGLAGEAAVAMLGAENKRDITRACRNYEKAWLEMRGKRHHKLAKVKDSLAKIPDDDYSNAADALQKIPRRSLLMSQIFKLSLGRFPRLVWAMRHLL